MREHWKIKTSFMQYFYGTLTMMLSAEKRERTSRICQFQDITGWTYKIQKSISLPVTYSDILYFVNCK
ncbi:hypothetical protein GCM10007199_03610 [Fictibacillus barbaricus]|nr:hypothetical protein GCM10007199_03610 [Fictibacillus barbaricus]